MFQGWRFSLARREWRVRFSSSPPLLTNLLRFMEQKIYQCGFYVMIGLILGVVISLSVFRRPMHIINPVTTDTIVVTDTQFVKLSDKTLMDQLKKHGIKHPHIVLAQAKLETGGYKSKVLRTHNNLFGLRKQGKYRRFNNWNESIIAYRDLVQYKYKGGDYYHFLHNLGYAEDPEYIRKLKGLS